MLLKDLKQDILIPKKEIFINKLVKIRDTDVVLISITSEEHRNVLWVMYQSFERIEHNDEIDDDIKDEPVTNRYEKMNAAQTNLNSRHFHLSEMIIQEQKMTFSSSETRPLSVSNFQGYMELQHFIENGLDTTYWDEVNLENIVIEAYQQESSEVFPQIDLEKELNITLKISKAYKELLINQPMHIEFGNVQIGTRYSFYDLINKKDRFYYIDKLEHYDIWEKVETTIKEKLLQGFTEEQGKQLEEQCKANLESICPREKDLAILEYETEDGVQLNFYATDYLDEYPKHSNSSSILLLKSDRKLGDNGFVNRLCAIKPIEKTFSECISVELFSWYLELPEEVIRT